MISLIFLVMEVGICYNKWEKIFYTNGGCIIMSEENFNTENGTFLHISQHLLRSPWLYWLLY